MRLADLIRQRLGHSVRPSLAARLEEHLLGCLRAGESLPDRLTHLEQAPLDDPMWRELLSVLLVPKTAWFRHAGQLAGLSQFLGAEGGLKIWSAGCCTGEEVYTLSMLFDTRTIELLGSDVNPDFLERARAGVYERFDLSEIPAHQEEALARRADGRLVLPARFKKRARFEVVNLAAPDPYPRPRVGRHWDVILCRNVFIYFDARARQRILSRLAERLTPSGLLLLSPAEQAPADVPLGLVQLSEGAFAYRRAKGLEEGRVMRERTRSRPPQPSSPPTWKAKPRPALDADPVPTPDPGDSPSSGDNLAGEAERLENSGNLAGAAALLERASREADLDASVHWRIGRAYRRLGEARLAGGSLRRALLLDPDCWAAAFQLAGVLFEGEEFAAARREYDRTRRILEDADDVDPFYRREVTASCLRRVAECQVRLSVR